MYLGLDLRGGVHFLLQVDMHGALTGRYDSLAIDIRTALRDADMKVSDVERSGLSVVATFDRSEAHTSELESLIRSSYAVFCSANKQPEKPPTPNAYVAAFHERPISRAYITTT